MSSEMLSLLFSFSPVHSLMLAADVSLRRTCAGSSRKLRPSRSTTSACRSASYLQADAGLVPCCQYSPKCPNTHNRVLIFTTAYQHSPQCTDIHPCIPMFTTVYQFPPWCINVHHSVPTLTTVDWCSPECTPVVLDMHKLRMAEYNA